MKQKSKTVDPIKEEDPVDPKPFVVEPPFKSGSNRICDVAITMDAIKGKEGISWKTNDPQKKVIDSFKFSSFSRRGQIKFRGTRTGRNRFHIEDGKIISSLDEKL